MRSVHYSGIGDVPGAVAAPDAALPSAALIEAWPGPAAVIARNGSVVRSNRFATPLLASLIAAAGTVRGSAVGRVLDPLTINGARGTETYELTAVPFGEGTLVTARDISLAANMRVALADSRRRYKDLVEISSDFAWETDRSGAFVFVSPRGALGFSAEQLVGRDASAVLGDEAVGDGESSPFRARRRIELQQIWVRDSARAPRCVAVSAVPLYDGDGAYAGARGLCRDITETIERDAELAEARNRERLSAYLTRTIRDELQPEAMLGAAAAAITRATGAAGAAIWRIDASATPRCAAEFGAHPPEGLDPGEVVAQLRDTARARGEAPLEFGRVIAVSATYRQSLNGAAMLWRNPDQPAWSDSDRAVVGDFAGQLGIALAQLEHHEALERLARNDAMTGLLNRRAFGEMLRQRLAQAGRSRRQGALLFIDLDNFKLVNDRFGHQRGDEALKLLADRLRQGSRVGDLAARLGGDEFALWLEDVDESGAVAKARALLALNRELAPFSGDATRPLGLSIGIAVHRPEQPETDAALILRADAAMYRVKHGAKNGLGIAPPAGTDA